MSALQGKLVSATRLRNEAEINFAKVSEKLDNIEFQLYSLKEELAQEENLKTLTENKIKFINDELNSVAGLENVEATNRKKATESTNLRQEKFASLRSERDDLIQKITIGIVIALILVTVFLISNTIKLTIYSRKNEIEIMRLVGASNTTIKLPFLFEGLFLGLIGSIIPVCITIYGYTILYNIMHGYLFTETLNLIKPYNFVFYVSGAIILLGAVVGMFGSTNSVRKYLKV